jgi:putative transcriptional regulator
LRNIVRHPARALLVLLLPLVATAQVGSTSLGVGRVLIADKDLHDPNFEATVIVLLSYDEDDGAGGVILNRPSETTVAQALKELPEARGNRDLAYQGGPVQTKRVLALLRAPSKLEDADEIVPGIYSVGTTKLLRKALTEKMDIRVFAGYAGWGPGQLEAEVDAGAWHIERGQASTVFDADPESMWQRMVSRLNRQIARAALKYQNALFYAARAGNVSFLGFLRQFTATGATGSRESTRAPARREGFTPRRSTGNNPI